MPMRYTLALRRSTTVITDDSIASHLKLPRMRRAHSQDVDLARLERDLPQRELSRKRMTNSRSVSLPCLR